MSTNEGFDIERVHRLVIQTSREDGEIEMDRYIETYEQLCKLFPLLGTVFGFVASDVNEKIDILKEYRKSAERDQFETITRMINYEVENKLTEKKHKPLSGSRTLLRLHRALEFVIEFMRSITTMNQSKKLTHVAGESYNKTLSHHHPWVIRKAVGVAMYTLPTGAQLLDKMGGASPEKTIELLKDVVNLAQPIYDKTQNLYTLNNLLNLP